MLHLFNKCYVYSDVLFDPSDDFVVVGQNYLSYGANIAVSAYHFNTAGAECLGRHQTLEDFYHSGTFEGILDASKERTIKIYIDNNEFIKLHAGLYKTYFIKLQSEYYVEKAKVFAAKINIRAKTLNNKQHVTQLVELSEMFASTDSIPAVKSFPLSKEWIASNAGIEWRVLKARLINSDIEIKTTLNELVYRYIYSFYQEAAHKFLGRCELLGDVSVDSIAAHPDTCWAADPRYATYSNYVSSIGIQFIEQLYQEIRKHTTPFADALVLEFLSSKDTNKLMHDPKFLLILAGNGNTLDKIDTWSMRYDMKVDSRTIREQGFVL